MFYFSAALALLLAAAKLFAAETATYSWWLIAAAFPGIPLALFTLFLIFFAIACVVAYFVQRKQPIDVYRTLRRETRR